MTANALFQTGLYLLMLFALARPLGLYMARVYSGQAEMASRLLGPVERLLYRLCGVDPTNALSASRETHFSEFPGVAEARCAGGWVITSRRCRG